MTLKFINAYKKAAAVVAAAFVAFPSGAMPASPKPVVMSDGLGGFVEVRVHGDERLHAVTSVDCTTLMLRDASGALRPGGSFDAGSFMAEAVRRAPQRRVVGNPSRFPCHGSQRAIAILVEFPETQQHPQGRRFRSEAPRDLFDRLLNADNYSDDGATGSVRQYFLDNSGGAFDLTFDVFGPVTLSRDVRFYCENEVNSWEMVEEACRGVDDEVNFADYDRDLDGVIDNVYIFYAGPGAATGGDPSDCIWQHASDVELLSGRQFTFDGVRLNHYACSNEYRDVKDPLTGRVSRQTEGIGTVCHEFSHVLGLPDFYDVTYTGQTSPGAWEVMDTGCHLNESRTPAAYSAIDRMLLGWLEPETIGDSPRTLSLPAITASGKAYRIPTTSDPDEFFVLENRQQSGWDAALPGHGLLLWRINYKSDFWNTNQVNTGKGASHAIVVCADGRTGEGTYPGDPFPGAAGVASITDDGYPNMLSSRGERTNAPLSAIVEAGGLITFDVCRAVTSLEKVSGLRATDVTPTAFTARWNAIPMSPGYVVSVTAAADGSPVGIYQNLSVAATSLRVSGLDPETDYSFSVHGVAGSVVGEESDPCTVSTPAMSFAFTAPTALAPEQVGPGSFTAAWMPLEGAVDYALTVLTMRRGADRMAAADFTGGIESLPAGWTTNCISTLSIKGYYGKSAPALSMGSDYARIQSPLLDHELLSVEFWYRERTPSGRSSIAVEVLADRRWTEIERVELTEAMTAGETLVIPSELIPDGAMAVRLIYHRVDSGTLAVDDVKITYRGEDEATAVDGWDDFRTGSAATSATVGPLTPATEYFYLVRGIDADGVMSEPSGMVSVTTADDDSAIEAVDAAADGGAPRMFDLNGRPVAPGSAAPGIYILKNGKETKKLIYR